MPKNNLSKVNKDGFCNIDSENVNKLLDGELFARSKLNTAITTSYYVSKQYDEFHVLNIDIIHIMLTDDLNKLIGYTRSYVIQAVDNIHMDNDKFFDVCDAIDSSLSHFAERVLDGMKIIQDYRNAHDPIQREMFVSECFDKGAIYYVESWEVSPEYQGCGYGKTLLTNTLTFLDEHYGVKRLLAFNSSPLNYREGELDFSTQDEIDKFEKMHDALSKTLNRLLNNHYKDSFYVNLANYIDIRTSYLKKDNAGNEFPDVGCNAPYLM